MTNGYNYLLMYGNKLSRLTSPIKTTLFFDLEISALISFPRIFYNYLTQETDKSLSSPITAHFAPTRGQKNKSPIISSPSKWNFAQLSKASRSRRSREQEKKKASAGVLQEGIATRGLLTRAFTAPL